MSRAAYKEGLQVGRLGKAAVSRVDVVPPLLLFQEFTIDKSRLTDKTLVDDAVTR